MSVYTSAPPPAPERGELGLSESVLTNITPPECRMKINL